MPTRKVKHTAVMKMKAGPMNSGKSEAIVTELVRATYAKKIILVVKSDKDNRSTRNIFTMIDEHRKLKNYGSLFKHTICSPEDLARLVKKYKPNVLAIDEAQLLGFHRRFIKYILKLLEDHKEENFTLFIGGLDMDYRAKPFGVMPYFMAIADEVEKLSAVCAVCEDDSCPAIFTQKIAGSQNQIEVGDDIYESRCRRCYVKPKETPE